MIQLTYEPAFDPLHAMYRALRLRDGTAADLRVPRDMFRILDFYLLFPERLQNMRFRQDHRRLKTLALATKRAPSYGPRPEDPVLFERMRPFQDAAVDTLALHYYFSPEALADGWVESEPTDVSPDLGEKIRSANEKEVGLMVALRTIAAEYPLEGPNGLKDRSGLLEHRYDAV